MKKFHDLKSIDIDGQRKKEDWSVIEHKLKKTANLNLQVPIILIAAVVVFFVLLLTKPSDLINNNASSESNEIHSILFTTLGYFPKSTMYPDVTKITDQNFLQQFQSILETSEQKEVSVDESEAFYHIIVANKADEKKNYLLVGADNADWLYDIGSGIAYIIPYGNEYNLYALLYSKENEGLSKSVSGLIALSFLWIMWLDEFLTRKKQGREEKLAMDSNFYQTIIRFSLIFYVAVLIILSIFNIYQSHYFIFLIPFAFSFILYVFNELRGSCNMWRIRNFLWLSLSMISFVSLVIYNLF